MIRGLVMEKGLLLHNSLIFDKAHRYQYDLVCVCVILISCDINKMVSIVLSNNRLIDLDGVRCVM